MAPLLAVTHQSSPPLSPKSSKEHFTTTEKWDLSPPAYLPSRPASCRKKYPPSLSWRASAPSGRLEESPPPSAPPSAQMRAPCCSSTLSLVSSFFNFLLASSLSSLLRLASFPRRSLRVLKFVSLSVNHRQTWAGGESLQP